MSGGRERVTRLGMMPHASSTKRCPACCCQQWVDFLLTLAEGGKEKSPILEYDRLEYYTRGLSVVKSLEDFREEYLEYDIRRQLELESYKRMVP